MTASVPKLVRWLSRVGMVPRAAITQLDQQRAPDPQAVMDAGRLAEQTYMELDRLQAPVVLLARMGQNLEQFGLTYSHLGFGFRGATGEWEVLHLLNADDGRRSGLYREGMLNFYCDSPYRFEAAVITLPRQVAARIFQMLKSGEAAALHHPNYSLTSHPDSLHTQNSNQWLLEVIAAAAQNRPATRAAAQAWLRDNGYKGSVLKIPLPTQWAGPLLRESINFEDQPEESRRDGDVCTVTVDSVIEWLRGENSPFAAQLGEIAVIRLGL